MSQLELEFDDDDLSQAVAKMEAVHNMEELQRVLDLHNLMLLSAPCRADTFGEGT